MSARVSDRQFAESRHQYTDPRTGERLVSVTKIVGHWDDGDKLGAGAGAAVKLTREGKDYRKIWNAKRDLGTRVHAHAAEWAMGKESQVLDSDLPYVDALALFCKEVSPEWLEIERAVVSSLGYGGKFDAVVYFDELYWLLDFKTGKPYKTELTIQLAGYRYADGMIRYDLAGGALDLEPLPHIDRCAGLYLDGEGGFTLVECPVDEAAFAAFKSLLSVHHWTKELS